MKPPAVVGLHAQPLLFRKTPRYGHARQSLPILLGVGTTALLLGFGISRVSATLVFPALAVALATVALVMLATWVGPGALAKTRNLAAGFRWWHGLWFLVFVSGLTFRGRDIDTIQDAAVDFWAAWRIGLMGVVAMVLLGRLATRKADWVPALLRGLPAGVFLYGLTSLLSTLWSVYPMWTLYKSLEYLVDVALLVAVVGAVRTVDEIKSLFDWTWLFSAVLLVTVWLGVLLRPEAVSTGVGLIGIQIRGVLPQIASNGVGELGAILLVVAATRLLFRNHHRSVYWLVCLAALPTLVLSQSRSPATGAVLGLLAVFVLARRFGLLTLVGLAAAALMLLTNAEAVVQQAFLRGQDPQSFHSLSGRLDYWTFALPILRENPFLGLGGYAAGRLAVLGPLGDPGNSSVHNAWLEILLGVGVIGLLPFLATFLGIWLNLLRPLDAGSTPSLATELQIETVGIFVLLCFRSIFTVEFIWHPPLLFFLVLGYAELLRRGRLEGTRAAQSAPAAWRRLSGVPAGVDRPLGDPVQGP